MNFIKNIAPIGFMIMILLFASRDAAYEKDFKYIDLPYKLRKKLYIINIPYIKKITLSALILQVSIWITIIVQLSCLIAAELIQMLPLNINTTTSDILYNIISTSIVYIFFSGTFISICILIISKLFAPERKRETIDDIYYTLNDNEIGVVFSRANNVVETSSILTDGRKILMSVHCLYNSKDVIISVIDETSMQKYHNTTKIKKINKQKLFFGQWGTNLEFWFYESNTGLTLIKYEDIIGVNNDLKGDIKLHKYEYKEDDSNMPSIFKKLYEVHVLNK